MARLSVRSSLIHALPVYSLATVLTTVNLHPYGPHLTFLFPLGLLHFIYLADVGSLPSHFGGRRLWACCCPFFARGRSCLPCPPAPVNLPATPLLSYTATWTSRLRLPPGAHVRCTRCRTPFLTHMLTYDVVWLCCHTFLPPPPMIPPTTCAHAFLHWLDSHCLRWTTRLPRAAAIIIKRRYCCMHLARFTPLLLCLHFSSGYLPIPPAFLPYRSRYRQDA